MIKLQIHDTYNGFIFTGDESELLSLVSLLRKLVVITDTLRDGNDDFITIPGETVKLTISDIIPQKVRSVYDPSFKDIQIADLTRQKEDNYRWWREAEDRLTAMKKDNPDS